MKRLKKRLQSVASRLVLGGLEGYKILDSRRSRDPFIRGSPISGGSKVPREKKIYVNPDWFGRRQLSDEMVAFLIAHDRSHIEKPQALGDEFAATMEGLKLLKLPKKKKAELAKTWYNRWWKTTPILTSKEYSREFMNLLHGRNWKVPKARARTVSCSLGGRKR